MKARAKHWVNYNGGWHVAGEVFPVSEADAEEISKYAELIEEEEAPEIVPESKPEPAPEAEISEPAKRQEIR